MAGDVEGVSERRDNGDGKRHDQKAPGRRTPATAKEPDEDQEARQPDVGRPARAVAGEMLREARQPLAAHEGKPVRNDDIEQIGVVTPGRVHRPGPESGQCVVQQRTRQRSREKIGERQGPHERSQALTPCRGNPPAGRECSRERERQAEEELRREGDLEREDHPEPEREASCRLPPVEVAEDEQGDQGNQEHRGHVQVALLLAEHVAREAEEVATGKRRPGRAGQVPAEEVGGPRGERRQEHRRRVVRHYRAGEERERRERERETGRRRRPGEVEAVGAQIAWVTNGFWPCRIACGHQANDQMKISGSVPAPTYRRPGWAATCSPKGTETRAGGRRRTPCAPHRRRRMMVAATDRRV